MNAKQTFLIFLLILILSLPSVSASIVVDTGTFGYSSIWTPIQRNSFYAEGRFWVFWVDENNNLYYKTSTDGLNWSETNIVCPVNGYGHRFDIYYDSNENKIYLVHTSGNGHGLYSEQAHHILMVL